MTKRTILVVDDQLINRKILGKILEKDYTIQNAENGKQALELLQENPDVSAVILDIVMPVMNGYEVLKIMHNDPVLSKIPVIVSSQKDGDEDEVKALSLGAYDFIAKPYKADIIHHRLKNMISFRETASMVNKIQKDEMTGLYNKQFFFEKVRERLEKYPGERYEMLCMGVEKFKLINETYGEEEGNKVLCYIASVLKESCRSIDICTRFSADEFYALIPFREKREKEVLFGYYNKINQYPIDMEIKIHCGVYTILGDEKSINTMCDRAKLAADMNRGKYDKSFDYYDESIQKRLIEEQFITSHMYEALDQRQFQVYYQPKYDLNNEMIAGAEALVRWIHPEKGFMSPGAFIPIFEKNGFVTQLDQYVWETVCRDMRSWLDQGFPPLAISVNVSRADIYNSKLTDILLGLVAKYRIPLHYLHLEITESAYTDNQDQIIEVVSKFRELGFVIEMDDFGSGYSSLNMLAKMPIDVLKLDMKFVQMESVNTSGKGILSFVISLAKWLDLAVVAEGVETSSQISTLRSMDCNYVQGFYFAKPMPLEEFEKLIKSSHTTEMVCNSSTVKEYVAKEIETEDAPNTQMLIVDDIEVNRAVLASTFFKDYIIVEKENGKEALEYLRENYKYVDVVLLDLLMPVMDGFQLLKKIREDEKLKSLAVIITSQGDMNSEQRALELQADDFISKPYKPDMIRHRVQNVVFSTKYKHIKEMNLSALYLEESENNANQLSREERIQLYIKAQRAHFDLVRLVDPNETLVYEAPEGCPLDQHFCYSVWGKHTRCSNCISIRALETKGRMCKMEYSNNALYFVIAEYVPYGERGAVVEMVTKLENDYVDNIFEKDLLYMNIESIHKQLEYDELTGVFNRRHIVKHLPVYLDTARKKGKNIGIAMIDMDSFKGLNDTHGHLVGDEVLKRVAEILQNNIAISKGDFVARFGGDEFIIVCRDIPREIFFKRLNTMEQIVNHMCLVLGETETGIIEDREKQSDIQGEVRSIDISIGCVNSMDYPEYELNELIQKADDRLYIAKNLGKGRVIMEDKDSKEKGEKNV